MLLDPRRQVIAEREVYIGQHDQVSVSPRWILKHALLEDARAVIIFHNHPPGDPTPSWPDIALTDHIRQACTTVDVELFDHLVIARNSYYSFRDAGRL